MEALAPVCKFRLSVILSREAGYHVEQEDVRKNLFIPEKYFKGSLEEFWNTIPELDAEFEQRRKILAAEGKCWRFVATMENGRTEVGLKEVDRESPFYHLAGSNNVILITTERYKEYPMQIKGYGAGVATDRASSQQSAGIAPPAADRQVESYGRSQTLCGASPLCGRGCRMPAASRYDGGRPMCGTLSSDGGVAVYGVDRRGSRVVRMGRGWLSASGLV